MQSVKSKLTSIVLKLASDSTGFRIITTQPSQCFSWLRLCSYSTTARLSRIYGTQTRFIPIAQMQHHRRTISTSSVVNQKTEKFILNDIGEGIKEVVIKEWMVKVGDQVKEFDPICEVESDKATVEITSRFQGKITKIYYETGAIALVGHPLVDIEMSLADETTEKVSQEGIAEEEQKVDKSSSRVSQQEMRLTELASVPALPSIRRIASENGVDLSKVKATGKHGRVLREDLLAFLTGRSNHTVSKPPTSQQQVPTNRKLPVSENAEEKIRFNGIQRAMYKTMSRSLEIPHFNYAEEIDLTQLTDMIARRKREAGKKAANGTGSVSSAFAFVIKMVSLALLEYPQLNGSVAEDNEHLLIKHYHNIGVAVDTKHGLVVPNIKNVERLSVEEISQELLRLRDCAYNSKLSTQDLSGGTITLSNIGAVGGTFGVPVIVPGELAICALGRTRKLPRYNEEQVEARLIMQVVWSADHRVVDGATLSRFVNLMKRLLEQPELALIKLK